MIEALLYEKLDKRSVHCFLCSHHCTIALGAFGFCGVRQNMDGVLYSHVYGKLVAANIDPIEKKPLYHFLPDSSSFSIATVGCNFRCGFCQNWEFSQESAKKGPLTTEEVPAEEVINAALKSKSQSIAYTYNEPTVFFEYALEVMKLAKAGNLRNVFVTNGFMTPECLQMAKPYLDGANADLKFFNDASYQKVCAGSLQPVLDSIRLMRQMGVWVEVTTLVIPGENDSEEELKGIAEFIAGIDAFTPWHISRFHPDYRFEEHSATPEKSLKKAMEIGKDAGLRYVYAGNVYGWGNDTFCHGCKKLLIKREGFSILENHVAGGKCSYCGVVIPGVFV